MDDFFGTDDAAADFLKREAEILGDDALLFSAGDAANPPATDIVDFNDFSDFTDAAPVSHDTNVFARYIYILFLMACLLERHNSQFYSISSSFHSLPIHVPRATIISTIIPTNST